MKKMSPHPTKERLELSDWINILLTILMLPVFLIGLLLVLIWAGCEDILISLKKKWKKDE